jgi:hypothetical protein
MKGTNWLATKEQNWFATKEHEYFLNSLWSAEKEKHPAHLVSFKEGNGKLNGFLYSTEKPPKVFLWCYHYLCSSFACQGSKLFDPVVS